jgi:hypothetical protein
MRQKALEIQLLGTFTVRWISVKDEILRFARKFFERRIQIESVSGGGNSQRALQIRRAGAGTKASFEKRLGPINDDFGGIEIVFGAQAVAFRTCAVR